MMEFHPLANIFPLIEGAEFDQLVASIKESKGPRDAIVVHEGMILDGRNRARACEAAGVEPRFTPLPADADPVAFVIDKNLRRRHLNESQRGMAAAKLANMPQGQPAEHAEEKPANLPVTQSAAGEMLNVSERTVRSAVKVRDEAEPELVDAVEQGHLAVSAAAQAAGLPPEQQREIAVQARAGKKNVVRTTIKKGRREKREKDLGAKQRALPEKKYGVIYADPEWRFEPYSRETGMDRAADNHYPTTTTTDIILRPVKKIAAKECVLFLWATAPMLPQALRVMSEWGFEYKTHLIWHKTRNGEGRGSGYWFTGEHELLLVGTHGEIPAPATAVGPSIIDAPWAGRHSEKPECFAEMIEALYPNLPKIELNARRARPGWDAWGLEAPEPVLGIPIPEQDQSVTQPPDGKSEIKALALSPDELWAKARAIAEAKGVQPVVDEQAAEVVRTFNAWEPEKGLGRSDPLPAKPLVESFDPDTGEIFEAGGSHEVASVQDPRDASPEAGEGYVVSPRDPVSGIRDDLEIPAFLRRTAE